MDIIQFKDKMYIPSPPLPAILLTPFVYFFGTSFSDIIFSVIIGAINVTLVQVIFRKIPLTIFFALGTSNWYFSSLGSVWFQAQSTAILFSLLSILFIRRLNYPTISGAMWALALLARPTIFFGVLLPISYIWTDNKSVSSRHKKVILFLIPIVVSICVMGVYNQIRFDNWKEFGYSYMTGAANITNTIAQKGTFSFSYLPCNLRVSFFEPPIIGNAISDSLFKSCSHLIHSGELNLPSKFIQPNPIGMSLFLASPLFILLPISFKDLRQNWVAWLSLVGIMLPNWLVHNTGSLQFGYRYWMDGAVVWLTILANILNYQTPDRWQKGIVFFLIAISILINIWGFGWMYQNFTGLNWL